MFLKVGKVINKTEKKSKTKRSIARNVNSLIMLVKLPGKKRFGPSGWAIQTKLQIYMWLGILKHKKYFIQGLPKGYEMSHELRNIDRLRALPPTVIHYIEKHVSIENIFK